MMEKTTQNWFFDEQDKKFNFEENGIDLAQINAALAGVKNKWYNVVKDNPDAFKALDRKWNWDQIIQLYKQHWKIDT